MELFLKMMLIVAVTMIRYFLITLPVFFFFYILFKAYFRKSKIQQKYAQRKDFLQEIKHSAISSLVVALLGAIVLSEPIKHFTQFYSGNKYPEWWTGVSVFIALIIHDTYFYWMHRIVHHQKIFRYVHLVHHKSTNPSPFAAYSFHVLEAILEGMILPIVLFLIPMNIKAVVLFTFIGFLINVYGHLGFEIMPKWFRKSFFFGVINTSVYHNMHHSKFKGNYGLYFRFWDRIMNTENPDYIPTYDKIQRERFVNSSRMIDAESEN